MEIRVLEYFLMVAQEENITKAAEKLHITQPTLSRQLKQLEDELGVTLLQRGKRRVTLTEDGILMKRRAQEIVLLAEKTKSEFENKSVNLSGEISIGCGEVKNAEFISGVIAAFRKVHPGVKFELYSAVADDIIVRLEMGLVDLGVVSEPFDVSNYGFLRMEKNDRWGVYVPWDHPLAQKKKVTAEDLLNEPVIIPKRSMVLNEVANWIGSQYSELNIVASYNLLYNATVLVENHVGIAICLRSATENERLKFIPLSPKFETGAALIWKKYHDLSPAVKAFVKMVKDTQKALDE